MITLQSQVPAFLYSKMIQNVSFTAITGGTATVSSLNGMTYSYGSGVVGAEMVGYKGNEVTEVIVISNNVAQTSLATIVAQDIT